MKVQISEKFAPMFKPKRIKVYFGGRGGMKTVSFAKIALITASINKRRFLCLREFMNSIEDSVHAVLQAEIETLRLQNRFRILNNYIEGINDSIFKYGQLARNIASIKSKHDFDVAWIEEAETVSEKSLDILIPTIRKPGSELWFSFNPAEEDGAVYKRFVKPYKEIIDVQGYYEDDDLYVGKVSYLDNPWLSEELKNDAEKMKRENYKKWLHVYGGECDANYDDALIQPEWVDAAIDAHIKLGLRPRGIRVVTFDPADSGQDEKALSKRYGVLVEDCVSWSEGDVADATIRAFDEAFDYRADDFIYDNIGLGAGTVKTHLRQSNDGNKMVVTGFGAGDSPDYPNEIYVPGNGEYISSTNNDDRTNRDTFRNKRAQYWVYLADRFYKTWRAVEKREYIDPDELISLSSKIKKLSQLKSELVKQQRKRTAGNRLIQLISKEEMRSKGIKSPNMADTLMMSFANPIRLKEDTEIFVPSSSSW
ncbi:PBSX family phage terminase large subunit [Candidatus Arsenophonus triatominarum]|uniref:PBSX family phage terminase large subunit n=1 Tax=Candidatus Arsenophonus triatominarum TaxID=57911 RepID=UPI000B0B44C9|nr:PBSX family phage terminase large subunit [Candidatus Arsenophonus triatominarum]